MYYRNMAYQMCEHYCAKICINRCSLVNQNCDMKSTACIYLKYMDMDVYLIEPWAMPIPQRIKRLCFSLIGAIYIIGGRKFCFQLFIFNIQLPSEYIDIAVCGCMLPAMLARCCSWGILIFEVCGPCIVGDMVWSRRFCGLDWLYIWLCVCVCVCIYSLFRFSFSFQELSLFTSHSILFWFLLLHTNQNTSLQLQLQARKRYLWMYKRYSCSHWTKAIKLSWEACNFLSHNLLLHWRFTWCYIEIN